jgi:hypothetical protein
MKSKIKTQAIPTEYKFEYLRSKQMILEVRRKIASIDIKTKEDEKLIKELLKEYNFLFNKIAELNSKIRKIS